MPPSAARRLSLCRCLALLGSLSCVAGGTPLAAGDGDPDPTFQTSGRWFEDQPSQGARAVAVAPDGRLLLGYTAVFAGTDRDMRVAKLGDLGASSACVSFHPDLGGTDEDTLADIAVLGGHVFLAGRSAGPPGNSPYQFAMAAFDLGACALWSGFGGPNGVLVDAAVPLEGEAIAVDRSGGLFAAVQAGAASSQSLESLGYSAAGVLGDVFLSNLATEGAVTFEPKAIAVQPDGKRVVVGTAVIAGGDRDVGVVQLLANGTADASFSGNGLLTFAFDVVDAGDDEGLAVAVLPGGRIVVAGSVERGSGTEAAVAILTPTGGFFNAFGNLGRFAFDLVGTGRQDLLRAVALQGDGKIVLAGRTAAAFPSPDFDFAVVRLLESGAVPFDTTFSQDGRSFANFDVGGTLSDEAWDLTLAPGGRIAVVGSATTESGIALAVARFQNAYIFADGFEWGDPLSGNGWSASVGGD